MRLGLTCVYGTQAVDDAADNINKGIDQAAEGASEGIDQAREYAEDPTKAVSDAAGSAESGVGQVADALKAGVRSVSQGAEDALGAAEETAEDARAQSKPLPGLPASARIPICRRCQHAGHGLSPQLWQQELARSGGLLRSNCALILECISSCCEHD